VPRVVLCSSVPEDLPFSSTMHIRNRDGRFVDFLSYLPRDRERAGQVLAAITKGILQGRERAIDFGADGSVMAKWEWLREYFNDFCELTGAEAARIEW
jgi:hypothetical protein